MIILMIEFDPNAPTGSPEHRWATYRPNSYSKNRRDWKTHATLRHARSAIDSACFAGIIAYERVDGVWAERFRQERPERILRPSEDCCAVCGLDYEEGKRAGKGYFLEPTWSPTADFEKVLCHFGCRRKLGVRRDSVV